MDKHVLVIDDEPVIRELIVVVLTGYGWQVKTARNGVQAIKMIEDFHYDLIISDIHMPFMSGIEFYKEIVKKYPELKKKIIFTTGNLDDTAETLIKTEGIQCLLKPFNISELLNLIDFHLRI